MVASIILGIACLRLYGPYVALLTICVSQVLYHDIGISRALGMTNAWIQRRHAQKGYGGTIEPAEF
ncbi:hypothetical protein VB636_16385, partial [Paracoccus sp. APAP_BH8]